MFLLAGWTMHIQDKELPCPHAFWLLMTKLFSAWIWKRCWFARVRDVRIARFSVIVVKSMDKWDIYPHVSRSPTPVDERTRRAVGLRPTGVHWLALEQRSWSDSCKTFAVKSESRARWETFSTRSCFYHVGAFYDGTLRNTIVQVLWWRVQVD